MDIGELVKSPLAQSGRSAHFVRLVLAEAAMFGMPGQTIAILDDLAAMLGIYDPAGVSIFDLSDVTWRDWYDDQIPPQEAVDEALADNDFPSSEE